MSEYFVHPVNGNDTTGDGSQNSPWKTREKARTSTSTGNHRVNVHAATIETVASTTQFRNGTGVGTEYAYGAYGYGDTPPILRADASVQDVAWMLGGSQYAIVEDWIFDAQGNNTRPFNLQSNSANVRDIIFRRCAFRNGGNSVGTRNGFTADAKLAGFTIRSLLFEDCEFSNAASHGLVAVGDVQYIARRCRAFGNGRHTGAHGFSSLAYRDTPTGWSGGPSIYSKAISNTPLQVVTSLASYRYLTNAGATASPAAGQFGFTGGTLYIHLGGANPASYTIYYNYTLCGPVEYEDCEAWGNLAYSPYPYVEGAGFQVDDFSVGNFKRCKSFDNEGPGFSFNIGASKGLLESCAARNNGRHGIVVSHATGVTVRYFTCDHNARNTAGSTDTQELILQNGAGAAVSNGLILTDKLYGVNCVDADSSAASSVARVNVRGATTAVNGITPTDLTAHDDGLREDFMPAGSGVRAAGTYVATTDLYGMAFANPPTLGAVQYQAAVAEPAMPGFLYDNRLNEGTPAASTTGDDFDVLNLRDLRPYSFWRPTTLPATVTVDCGSPLPADFAAVCGHDLATRHCWIEIRGSTDNFSSSDVLLIKRKPDADVPLILPFASVEYRYWRIRINGQELPTLAIALIGEALRLPRRQVLGFDPVARSARTMTNQSAGGYPLGKVTAFEEWRQKVALDVVQWAWLRETWLPAWREHLRDEPFLYAWDSTDHADEVYLVTTSGEFAAPTLGGDKCSFEVEISGAVP